MSIIGKILTERLKYHEKVLKILEICTDLGYWRLEALLACQQPATVVLDGEKLPCPDKIRCFTH